MYIFVLMNNHQSLFSTSLPHTRTSSSRILLSLMKSVLLWLSSYYQSPQSHPSSYRQLQEAHKLSCSGPDFTLTKSLNFLDLHLEITVVCIPLHP